MSMVVKVGPAVGNGVLQLFGGALEDRNFILKEMSILYNLLQLKTTFPI